MTVWQASRPAYGGYYEHALVNGHSLTIRTTANGRYVARMDGAKLRGACTTVEAARAAAERAAAAAPAPAPEPEPPAEPGGPVTASGTRATWLDYGPAEFDSSLLPRGARRSLDRDQGALFVVAVPPRERRQPAREELPGQVDLFGGEL